MKAISIRIDDDVKDRLDSLTQAHGLNVSHLMRLAISEKLEELEDFYMVRKRLAEPFVPVSNEDVWKQAGLAD